MFLSSINLKTTFFISSLSLHFLTDLVSRCKPLFIDLKQLTEKKVTKNFLFEPKEDFISPTPILIYIIPSSIELLKIIEKHILINNKIEFHIIFIPKITIECSNFIETSKNKSF